MIQKHCKFRIMHRFKLLHEEHVTRPLWRNVVDQKHFHLGETIK